MEEKRQLRAQRYDRWLQRWIPRYAVQPLLFCLIYNCFLYWTAQLLVSGRNPVTMLTPLDEQMPLCPAFVLVYFGTFAFWVVNFILIARSGREHWFRFFTANIIALTVSAVIFTVLPATMPRPEITGSGVLPFLMRFLYAVDAPTNLFPSLHCMASWLCTVFLWGCKRVPLWYRILSYGIALTICASTLLVHQHVVADVIAGVALAQGVYLLARFTRWYRGSERVSARLEVCLFGVSNGQDEKA